MKRLSKIVAVVLALTTLATSLCITAFADNSTVDISRFSEGTGYLAFGDSITRGYGASDKWDEEGYRMDNTKNPNCRNVTGSYPKIIADAIGCNTDNNILNKEATYWPIAQDAMTASFIVDLLGIEDDYYDADYTHGNSAMIRRYDTDLYYFGDEESMTQDGTARYGKDGVAMSVCDLIADASLITSAIGMGEVFCRAQALALQEGNMSDTDGIVKLVESLIYRLYEGYDSWVKEYPKVLQYFKENTREDCTVVVVGAINPMYGMNITDEVFLPVGNAVSVISGLMNQQCKKWAEEYGFLFVDISNVETGSTANDMSFTRFLSLKTREQGLATHPTPEGYAQIANMILAALREHEATHKSAKTDIRVDLGRIKRVSDVCVNGNSIPACNYTLKDGVLTIPYYTPFAKSLTVTSVGSNGKVAMTVYSLSYDDGYSAHRLYTTNDVGAVAKSAAKNVVGVVSKLFSLIKK